MMSCRSRHVEDGHALESGVVGLGGKNKSYMLYARRLEFFGAIPIAVDEVSSSRLAMKSIARFFSLAFTGVNELRDPVSRLILFNIFNFHDSWQFGFYETLYYL
jgi:hypothetical protein